MKKLSIPGLVVMASLTAGAALVSPALAQELPEILPLVGFTRMWKGTQEGATEFRTSIENNEQVIKCPEGTSEGTEESKKPLGLFHFHFLGCSTEIMKQVFKCTDLNHNKITEAGSILVLGTWHSVWDRKNGVAKFELTTGPLFLVESTHFGCGATILIRLEGEQVCLDLDPTKLAKVHSFHCIAENTGQTEEWCKKNNMLSECLEPVKPVLKVFVNEALNATTSAELALGNIVANEELMTDI